jgi:hypothetical protein
LKTLEDDYIAFLLLAQKCTDFTKQVLMLWAFGLGQMNFPI